MCSGLQLASQSARGICRGWAGGFPFFPFLPRGTGVERPGWTDGRTGEGQRCPLAASVILLLANLRITRVVGQGLGGPVFAGGNQVPDEALDVLVAAVMEQTVGQEGSADGLHVRLLHGAFKATVSQDVVPPSPTEEAEGERVRLARARSRGAEDRQSQLLGHVSIPLASP